MKKNNKNVNSISKSFIKPIFTFFVVVIPALILWIFFSKDFKFLWKDDYIEISWWIKFAISLAFIIFTFSITFLFIYFNLLDISIFSFSLPVSICFMVIFLSDSLEPWIRLLIIVPFIFLSIPIIFFVKKIEFKFKRKKELINKKQIKKVK